MSHGVNVLALVKGDQRYIFLFDNQSREQMLKTLEGALVRGGAGGGERMEEGGERSGA
ncbi:MAG: hypothetical protein ACKOJF_02335 [Planctomycetaceae bacterium]